MAPIYIKLLDQVEVVPVFVLIDTLMFNQDGFVLLTHNDETVVLPERYKVLRVNVSPDHVKSYKLISAL